MRVSEILRTVSLRFVLVLIALTFVLPATFVLAHLFQPWSELWSHVGEYLLPQTLLNTFVLLLGVSIVTLPLGVTLGWLCSSCDFPGRRIWEWMLCLPLAIPAYVTGFVAVGFINEFSLGISRSISTAALVFSLCLFPYIYLVSYAAFRTQGLRAFETARVLGRKPLNAFLSAALPTARHAIIGGWILVLMEVLADFGTVSIFNIDTFTVLIYRAWFSFFSLSTALQLSGLLLLATLLLLSWGQWNDRQGKHLAQNTGAGRGGKTARLRLEGLNATAASLFCFFVALLAGVLPILQLLYWSMGEGLGSRLLEMQPYLKTSIWIGATTVLLVLSISLFMVLLQRFQKPSVLFGSTALFTRYGYAVPGTVLALGVFAPFAEMELYLGDLLQLKWGWEPSLFLTGSGLVLILGLVIRFFALGLQPLQSSLNAIPVRTDEASRSLGVTGLHMVKRIHLPLLGRGLGVGSLFVFIDTLKEMPLTLMTRPLGWDTLSVRIYEFTSEGLWQKAALPSLILVAIGLIPALTLRKKLQ